jgi:hypothetical protein
VVVALAALATIALKDEREPSQVPSPGLNISLDVEPFAVGDSVGESWDAVGFADSLAAQLSMVRGIQATTGGSSTRFVLRGNVAMKEGRLILATQLGRDGERDTIWTATFWRSATSGSSVLSDLAAAVAEAVFSESARESLASKRWKP